MIVVHPLAMVADGNEREYEDLKDLQPRVTDLGGAGPYKVS